MVTRPRARTKSKPSGRTAWIVSIAPVCRASAAVCVCVRLKTGHSGVCSKKLGVVSDTPAAVVSVDVNVQSVKSASALHGPFSRI